MANENPRISEIHFERNPWISWDAFQSFPKHSKAIPKDKEPMPRDEGISYSTGIPKVSLVIGTRDYESGLMLV